MKAIDTSIKLITVTVLSDDDHFYSSASIKCSDKDKDYLAMAKEIGGKLWRATLNPKKLTITEEPFNILYKYP